MMERWLPISGYEGLYEVSDRGRIRSLHGAGKIRATPLVAGYPSLFLSKGGKKKFFYVHALVTRAFLGPCPEGKEVAHWDGVKTNCVLANLRYATPVENDADKIKHGTRPEGTKNGHATLTEYDVIVIRTRVSAGEKQKTVGADYGVGSGRMSLIVNRIIWRHI